MPNNEDRDTVRRKSVICQALLDAEEHANRMNLKDSIKNVKLALKNLQVLEVRRQKNHGGYKV